MENKKESDSIQFDSVRFSSIQLDSICFALILFTLFESVPFDAFIQKADTSTELMYKLSLYETHYKDPSSFFPPPQQKETGNKTKNSSFEIY